MRTLIIDDEPLAIERLQLLCDRLPSIYIVGTAGDGDSALHMINALAPDLLLLDVTMPEIDGLELARMLAMQARSPAIIFVTAHNHFAVAAFDCEAVDYLLKPVSPERLSRAVERAEARRRQKETAQSADQVYPAVADASLAQTWLEEFWVPHRNELVRLAVDDIDRIDAERDYVRLFAGDRSYLMLHTIQGLEDRLDPARFIRVHRSTMVSRTQIAGLRHDGLGVWSVELNDGTLLRIGRTYLAKVKAMAGR